MRRTPFSAGNRFRFDSVVNDGWEMFEMSCSSISCSVFPHPHPRSATDVVKGVERRWCRCFDQFSLLNLSLWKTSFDVFAEAMAKRRPFIDKLEELDESNEEEEES